MINEARLKQLASQHADPLELARAVNTESSAQAHEHRKYIDARKAFHKARCIRESHDKKHGPNMMADFAADMLELTAERLAGVK